MSDNNELGSAIGIYFFIAVVFAFAHAGSVKPNSLGVQEIGFWTKTLVFILSVPAGTIGLLIGRFIRDALRPDIVMYRSTMDLAFTKLFWVFMPQIIGLGAGNLLVEKVVKAMIGS